MAKNVGFRKEFGIVPSFTYVKIFLLLSVNAKDHDTYLLFIPARVVLNIPTGRST